MAPRSLLPPETVVEVDLTKIVRVADNDQDYDGNDHHDGLQFGHLPLFSFVQLEEFSASALTHLIIMIIKSMIIKILFSPMPLQQSCRGRVGRLKTTTKASSKV